MVDPQKVQQRITIRLGNPTSGSPPHGTESRDSDGRTPKCTAALPQQRAGRNYCGSLDRRVVTKCGPSTQWSNSRPKKERHPDACRSRGGLKVMPLSGRATPRSHVIRPTCVMCRVTTCHIPLTHLCHVLCERVTCHMTHVYHVSRDPLVSCIYNPLVSHLTTHACHVLHVPLV